MGKENIKIESIPVVSVIITCYNYAKYLSESVSSVVRQTFQNLEIIIVDDGSTDDTVITAESLQKENPKHNIKLISQNNSGVANARNKGIEQSHGKYILCLDADDMIDPEMLSESVDILRHQPAVDIVYTDRMDFGEKEKITPAGDFDKEKLLFQNCISYCALFKREIWDKVGGYRTNVDGCEDWDFWIAVSAMGYKGYRIPKPLFRYRQHREGLYFRLMENFTLKKAQIILNNHAFYEANDVQAAHKRFFRKDEKNPTFSVILPTYNRPELLKNAIESVLSQTYNDFELLVVNDGGVEVESIVNKCDSKKIKYFNREKNRGVANARNYGLFWARGKYICYLDDDDMYLENHLETLISHYESYNSKAVYTDAFRTVREKSNGSFIVKDKDIRYSLDFNHNEILINNFIPIICLSHERWCLEEAGVFDESLEVFEDWDFIIRLSQKFALTHIKETTGEYSWQPLGDSLMRKHSNSLFEATKTIYQKHFNLSQNNTYILEAQKEFLKNSFSERTSMSSDCYAIYNNGFYNDEGGWRWMGDEGIFQVMRDDSADNKIYFFNLTCGKKSFYRKFPFEVFVFIDGTHRKTVKFKKENQSNRIYVRTQVGSLKTTKIRLASEQSFIPFLVNNLKDVRRLSVIVSIVRTLEGQSSIEDWVRYYLFRLKNIFSG